MIMPWLWGGGRKGVIDYGPFGIDPAGFSANYSGVPISELSALTATAVWACVRALFESVGSMPVGVIRREGNTRHQVDDHPVHLLLDSPAELCSTQVFLETLVANTALWGNGYAVLDIGTQDDVIAAHPVRSDRVQIADVGTSCRYRVSDPNLGNLTLPPDRMLHLKRFTLDGKRGLSPVGAARQAIGIDKAAEETAAKMFSKGVRAGGVLAFKEPLDEDQAAAIEERIKQKQTGLKNAGETLIVGSDASWSSWTIPPDEAQFLESRKFQTIEIARIYRMPPHIIGDLERATFSNIEHQALEFVVYTLMPWLVACEQELKRKLFRRAEDRIHHCVKFHVNALLRGDLKARYMAYAIGRQWGWLNANKILELEDMNPIGPQGDVYLTPANMQPADALGDAIKDDEKAEAGKGGIVQHVRDLRLALGVAALQEEAA